MNKKTWVFSGNAEVRLDHFLVEQLPDLSRSRIQQNIKDQKVLVNDSNEKSGFILKDGDTIKFALDESPTESATIDPEKIPLDILFEDDEIIVINKSAGMVVHPGTGRSAGTLVNALMNHCNELSTINGKLRPGIVHRLDQETSGVIVAAKTNKAHSFIAEQFQSRTVKKKYVGITWGRWEQEKGEIDAPLKRSRKDPTSFIVDNNGRSAKTLYKVVGDHRVMSIVHFYPHTGRTHQIRVHATYMHHPIVNDPKYNGGENRLKGFLPEVKKDLSLQLKKIGRHALHAHELSFIHPLTNENVKFSAPIPADIQSLIEHLKDHYN